MALPQAACDCVTAWLLRWFLYMALGLMQSLQSGLSGHLNLVAHWSIFLWHILTSVHMLVKAGCLQCRCETYAGLKAVSDCKVSMVCSPALACLHIG